jgi:hypothetical protein
MERERTGMTPQRKQELERRRRRAKEMRARNPRSKGRR